MVFVNLTDYSGMPVELAMSRVDAIETADAGPQAMRLKG